MVRCELPQSWWFDSRIDPSRQSPWLLSTLSDLEEKTKQMLKLIEHDADSFAQRAEMYYKKRPLLVSMIGDFYRAHRALAEHCDQLKAAAPRLAVFGPPRWVVSKCNSTSAASSDYDDSVSEVDDPEQEEEEEEEETAADSTDANDGELERLRERNAALERLLATKDEEKREVIRQLSSAIGILKEENDTLRRKASEASRGGGGGRGGMYVDLKKLARGFFSGEMFEFGGGGKPATAVVAL